LPKSQICRKIPLLTLSKAILDNLDIWQNKTCGGIENSGQAGGQENCRMSIVDCRFKSTTKFTAEDMDGAENF